LNHSYELSNMFTPVEMAIGCANQSVLLEPASARTRCLMASALLVKGELGSAHRELELAMLGRQPEQVVQPEVNEGRVFGGLDMEIRSIGQQHGEQPDHRSPSEGVAMDLLQLASQRRA
jgi:hypothetical protein